MKDSSVELLDQYEDEWQRGGSPDLLAYAEALRNRSQSHLIGELCQVDMELRWRAERTTTDLRSARDYVMLPEMMDTDEFCELICAEYRIRNHCGDYPSAGSVLEHWPELRAKLAEMLMLTAASIDRPIVRVTGAEPAVVPFSLDGVLEIGRQTGADPPPFSLISTREGWRLIVASVDDSKISRHQIRLARHSESELRICNTSRNRAVAILEQQILAAGESSVCRMPAKIHLGGRLIVRIEPAR